jgi:Flp pilus assembly pilin Flp
LFKTKVRSYIKNFKQTVQDVAVKVRVQETKMQEVLINEQGASAIEIALAAVAAVVFICIIVNAFTGIFTNTIIPGLEGKIEDIFSMK